MKRIYACQTGLETVGIVIISVGIILSRGASPFMNMIHAYATRVDRHALPLPRVPFAFIDHPFHSSKEMLFSTVKTALAMEPP